MGKLSYYIQLILAHSKTDVNLKDISGCLALQIAAERRSREIIELFVSDPRIDPNRRIRKLTMSSTEGITEVRTGLRVYVGSVICRVLAILLAVNFMIMENRLAMVGSGQDIMLDYYLLMAKLSKALSIASATVFELLECKDSQQQSITPKELKTRWKR